MIRHFFLLNQNHATSSSGLLGCRPLFLDSCSTIDVIFQISQTSSKFVQRWLVMKNQPRHLRQSETEKYLEWIIISNYWMDRAEKVNPKSYGDRARCYLLDLRKWKIIIISNYWMRLCRMWRLLCRSGSMLCTEAEVDSILRDLHNSLHDSQTKAEFKNCFIIHWKYFKVLDMLTFSETFFKSLPTTRHGFRI